MKENYGAQIFKTKLDKKIKEYILILLVSFLIAIAISCLIIQLNFTSGLHGFFAFVKLKIVQTIKCEYLPNSFPFIKSFQPTQSEIILYNKINKFWLHYLGHMKVYLSNLVIITVFSFFLIRKLFYRYGEKEQSRRYEREDELRLVSNNEIIIEIKDEVKRKNNDISYTPQDMYFGKNKIRIPFGLLSTHIGYVGASKTGKTNAINELLIQDRVLNSKCLVVDPKGQFFAKHGKPGDKILSLFDLRQEKWDFWCENISFKFLANALVEVKESSSQNRFFDKSGREILAAALKHTKNVDELWEVVNYSMKSLHDFLYDNAELSKQLLGEDAGGQSSGIIATSILNMNFIKYMNHHVYERQRKTGNIEKSFSLTEWVNNDDNNSWVFIIDDIRNLTEAQPLHRLWFDIVTNSAYDRNIQKQNAKQINLYCDEITTVGNLPTLPTVLDKGRNFKLRLIIGFQSYAQLELIYGKESATNIFQGLQTVFCFASNNEQEARIFSERMGRSTVIEADESIALNKNNNTNISYRNREIYNVTPSQIQALKDNFCYAKIARVNPTKIEFRYHILPEINQGSESEIPESTKFDGMITKQYESKEEKENNQKSENYSLKILEMNQIVKDLVEEAFSVFTNSQPEKVEEIGRKIMEKFGSSQGIKMKICENTYSISIHKPSKIIYISINQTEFAIPFPKVTLEIFDKKEKDDSKKPIASTHQNNENSDDPNSKEKLQFKSIPIKLKKTYSDKKELNT
jgi:hypothetical protein